MKIIVDAMGGDNAPLEIVKGALQAQKRFGVDIVFTGDEAAILDAVRRCGDDTPGKKAAAAALGICVATLYRKLKEYEDEAAALSRTT